MLNNYEFEGGPWDGATVKFNIPPKFYHVYTKPKHIAYSSAETVDLERYRYHHLYEIAFRIENGSQKVYYTYKGLENERD